jgi:hypothetical protein
MMKYTIQQLYNIVEASIKWIPSIDPLDYDVWPRLRKIAEMDLTPLGLPLIKCYVSDFEWIRGLSIEYQDVIMGSNWGRWKFTPRDEFWTDNTIARIEDKTTLIHEGCEYYAIMILGLSYFGDDGAHQIYGNGSERIRRLKKQEAMSRPMIIYP